MVKYIMESKCSSNKSIEEYALMKNFADAPGSVENFAIGLSDAEYEGVWQWSSAMDDDSCKYCNFKFNKKFYFHITMNIDFLRYPILQTDSLNVAME